MSILPNPEGSFARPFKTGPLQNVKRVHWNTATEEFVRLKWSYRYIYKGPLEKTLDLRFSIDDLGGSDLLEPNNFTIGDKFRPVPPQGFGKLALKHLYCWGKVDTFEETLTTNTESFAIVDTFHYIAYCRGEVFGVHAIPGSGGSDFPGPFTYGTILEILRTDNPSYGIPRARAWFNDPGIGPADMSWVFVVDSSHTTTTTVTTHTQNAAGTVQVNMGLIKKYLKTKNPGNPPEAINIRVSVDEFPRNTAGTWTLTFDSFKKKNEEPRVDRYTVTKANVDNARIPPYAVLDRVKFKSLINVGSATAL